VYLDGRITEPILGVVGLTLSGRSVVCRRPSLSDPHDQSGRGEWPRRRRRRLIASFTSVVAGPHSAAAATKHRVLFDNSKAETAATPTGSSARAFPTRPRRRRHRQWRPTWTGAISAWGVALQKTGNYTLATLGAGKTITYGNSSNAQDLSNFDEFVLPEPNVCSARRRRPR